METGEDNRNRKPSAAAAEEESVAARLIEKATTSTRPEVEPRLLKAIKSVVRRSDSELRHASRTLIYLMKRDHSQVRYLSLLIIDELFMRSKLFRTILVENLDLLLSLSVGFRRNLPLPAPAAVASVLRTKAIEFLEKWNVSFGVHYRQLRLGYDYLKNTLRYQFPNLQANAERIRQERKEREMKTREILLSKFESLKGNFESIKNDIQSTVDEVNECMDIIRNEEDDIPLDSVDDEDMELFHNSELRQIRLESLKEADKVEENSENKVVFDAIRELYKVIVTKHLVTVQEWISVLIRVDVTDTRFRDSTFKEFMDIRDNLRLVKKKCEESGCSLPETTDVEEEEDIWEEGTLDLSKSPSAIANSELFVPTTSESKDKVIECSNPTSKGKKKVVNDSNPLKRQLLSEAPVVPWGSSLDYWDSSQRDVIANQRGLDIEGHWGRVDRDAVIPGEKIAELRMQASVYKEEPVEILPCRAPLRKGGLCARKDLKVCPFHGPVVPRDDEGKPIIDEQILPDVKNSGSSEEEDRDIPHHDFDEKLVKQAVSNLRERDKEALKKREYDKKASKKAKLAKVREHNAEVLRDAAIASTSVSSHIGGDVRSTARNEKDSLASMLKKKVTAKDRLSQKLLTTRATDATTRQLTMDEESKYREAFPNQW